MNSHQPSVWIIILIYNNGEAVKQCVESIEKITYTNAHVLLVDNASPDKSGTELQKRFPRAAFIANDRNVGFARGCNMGIEYAVSRDADFVLLLNGDMLVEPDFLEPIVSLFENNPRAGLASGVIFHQHDQELLWYAGGRIDLWRGQLVTPGARRKVNTLPVEPFTTNFCTGAMMLIPSKVLMNVGYLPDEYFFGVEEWDYSLSVKKSGLDLYVVPQSRAYHVAGESQDHSNAKWHYNFYRNKIIFQRKFLSPIWFTLWKFLFLFYVLLLLPIRKRSLHGDRLSSRELVAAARRALIDQDGTTAIQETDLIEFERYLYGIVSEI